MRPAKSHTAVLLLAVLLLWLVCDHAHADPYADSLRVHGCIGSCFSGNLSSAIGYPDGSYSLVDYVNYPYVDIVFLDNELDDIPGIDIHFCTTTHSGWVVSSLVSASGQSFNLGTPIGNLDLATLGLPPGFLPIRTVVLHFQGGCSPWCDDTNRLRLDAVMCDVPGGVGESAAVSASRFDPPRPNPAAGSVTFSFDLARGGEAHLTVFDPSGRVVAELGGAVLTAGSHVLAWDGTDRRGGLVPSGVYYCRLVAGTLEETRRLIVAR